MILGIRVDNFSREEIHDRIKDVLGAPPKQKFIVTLNPEIILKGYRNKGFGNILNSADFKLCDGFGVKLAARFKGGKIKSRYTGVDLVDHALKLAKEKNLRTLVVVAQNSLSSPNEIKKSIRGKYGVEASAEYFRDGSFFENTAAQNAEIVFVNFGAPEQEEFIFSNRRKFPKAKILAGVGGTFDFFTGKMKRAPRIMRRLGLEWLWRVVQEPKRAKRIWNAVFVFPCLVILNRKEKCRN